MPDYGKGIKDPEGGATSKSPLSSFTRWLQIKKYQYEVTTSLYMLTPTEKFVFNVIILVLFTLLVAAAVAYLPNHIAVISNRLWYYVHGEFLYATAGTAAQSSTKQALETTGKLVQGMASQTAEQVVRQAHEL
ncbi:uncharacterized protein HMPREF1541_04604 [Cyphellophora europaea CBS 101466]|uniref:Uncharacterized protein n=1 Tax=Cyphellophora europaea (strain CBS 101466) TaxID=1220924 RepID=W2RX17_CYPE1|nr:uncharacterized protein HMPREF1541_04604 [Cyphellophora europaea CBS 101466]ETN40328.1 hypothetical protein HMPREF1541_04604 [Cyphellophora europaea CBS 101466]